MTDFTVNCGEGAFFTLTAVGENKLQLTAVTVEVGHIRKSDPFVCVYLELIQQKGAFGVKLDDLGIAVMKTHHQLLKGVFSPEVKSLNCALMDVRAQPDIADCLQLTAKTEAEIWNYNVHGKPLMKKDTEETVHPPAKLQKCFDEVMERFASVKPQHAFDKVRPPAIDLASVPSVEAPSVQAPSAIDEASAPSVEGPVLDEPGEDDSPRRDTGLHQNCLQPPKAPQANQRAQSHGESFHFQKFGTRSPHPMFCLVTVRIVGGITTLTAAQLVQKIYFLAGREGCMR